MPRHYARDVNVISGRVTFNNSRVAYVYFKNGEGKQISFSRRPFVSLTVEDDSNKPATRIGWIKSGKLYIGCKIKFKSRFNGIVAWEVKE